MAENKGWIKLHRRLIQKEIWKNSTVEQRVILITLLLMANYEHNEWQWKGQSFICKPGQLVTSLNSIAEVSGKDISIKQIRTALEKFEKHGFLISDKIKSGRLITIVNWGLYQAKEEKKDVE